MNRIVNVFAETKERYYRLFGKDVKQISDLRFRDACVRAMMIEENMSYDRMDNVYEAFDKEHDGRNTHNLWRNKLFAVHEYYEHTAPQKKIFVNTICLEMYKQVAMGPSGDIIESDNDDYYFNGSNESSYFDEWNSQSVPLLAAEQIVHQPVLPPVIPSNTIIHTVNVKRKKKN